VANPEPLIPGDIVRISDVELKLEFEKDPPPVAVLTPPPTPWTLEKQIRAETLPWDADPANAVPAAGAAAVVAAAPRARPSTEDRLIEIEHPPAPATPAARAVPETKPPPPAAPVPTSTAVLDFDDTSAGLPRVWFVLDVSGSMAGAPIAALAKGLQSLVAEPLANLPEFMLILITFGSVVRSDYTPARRTAFKVPEINAEGFSALSAALNFLRERLTRTATAPKPLVFLLTDGGGTDDPKGRLPTPPGADLCRLCVGIYGDRDVPPALVQGAEAAVRAARPGDFPALFDWIRTLIKAPHAGTLPPGIVRF
jgi:uncharacterized protein YegL